MSKTSFHSDSSSMIGPNVSAVKTVTTWQSPDNGQY